MELNPVVFLLEQAESRAVQSFNSVENAGLIPPNTTFFATQSYKPILVMQ